MGNSLMSYLRLSTSSDIIWAILYDVFIICNNTLWDHMIDHMMVLYNGYKYVDRPAPSLTISYIDSNSSDLNSGHQNY